MRSVNVLSRCALALGVLIAASAHADGKLGVYDAWIRLPPPGAKMMAGYATLKNTGDASLSILTVQSNAFRGSSIHETVTERDVTRMRELPRVDLAAGAEVEMKPGGAHLMLSEPRHPIAAGDKIPIVFLLADGTRVETNFEVMAEPQKSGE